MQGRCQARDICFKAASAVGVVCIIFYKNIIFSI